VRYKAGVPIAEILPQHNIGKATYLQWRPKYAGASVAELKRLKELEAENAKLKRMYAELALENAAITHVLRMFRAGALRSSRIIAPLERFQVFDGIAEWVRNRGCGIALEARTGAAVDQHN
jgi:putative transposase